MGTHHFNRKNMFHTVRHSTSVLIFRAYQAPHLDLPICKCGRTRKWPASLKKCGMSSSQLPQRTTPALLNGETIWNYHPKSSLNYTNLHSSTNFQTIWDLPMGPRWDMRWRRTAGGVFQQFLAGVSRLTMVISARSPLIPWDDSWGLRDGAGATWCLPISKATDSEQGYQWEKSGFIDQQFENTFVIVYSGFTIVYKIPSVTTVCYRVA